MIELSVLQLTTALTFALFVGVVGGGLVMALVTAAGKTPCTRCAAGATPGERGKE